MLRSRRLQIPLAALGLFTLGGLLAAHIAKDLAAPVSHWALRSTLVWVIVMSVASLIYWLEVRSSGVRASTSTPISRPCPRSKAS